MANTDLEEAIEAVLIKYHVAMWLVVDDPARDACLGVADRGDLASDLATAAKHHLLRGIDA